jgi:hypothetical protein
MSALCAKRREIDMRRHVGVARRMQRIGEGMSGDGLQRFAQSLAARGRNR